MRAAVCPFESMAGAATTVIQTIQLGIPVARIEIVDEAQLRVVNAYSKTNYPLAPTLFFEFHGISDVDGARIRSAPSKRSPASTAPRASVGVVARGSHHAVAGAAQRLLRDRRVAAGRAGVDDGHLRADFAPRGVHSRDAAGSERRQRHCAARRPCRRRQLPPDHHARPVRSEGVRPRSRA